MFHKKVKLIVTFVTLLLADYDDGYPPIFRLGSPRRLNISTVRSSKGYSVIYVI